MTLIWKPLLNERMTENKLRNGVCVRICAREETKDLTERSISAKGRGIQSMQGFYAAAAALDQIQPHY